MQMNRHADLRINADRLWGSLMDMARIGATARGGCNRQALTDLDKQGRDLFVHWCRDAGCRVEVDQMGNIFARRDGRAGDLPPVLAGSHLDTQPTGGRFDGVFGVLSGLEVIRTLNDHDIETDHPLQVVCWTNEEGARFSPAMIGSGVWAGVFDLDFALAREDRDGNSIGGELQRIGYAGERACAATPVKAAFEVHIEQGPILEQEKLQIGVLTGVQGMNWYDLNIVGQACHAGPTPMENRRDPVQGMTRIIDQLYNMVLDHGPWSRITFGVIRVQPGSRNTVPERLTVTIDLRHPQQDVLERMDGRLREVVTAVCRTLRLEGSVHDEWQSPAVAFHPDCIGAVQRAVDMLEFPHLQMVSGAGHDSVYVSRVAPTGMIFVPCEGGLSHNEAENAAPRDLTAGCNVLLHSMLDQAMI